MGILRVTISALGAAGDCKVKIDAAPELTEAQSNYIAACDSLDTLVWGAPLGGYSKRKKASDEQKAAADEQKAAAGEQPKTGGLPAWVARNMNKSEKKAKVSLPKLDYWERDRALLQRLDPEHVAVERSVAAAKAAPAPDPLPPGKVQTHCGLMDPADCDMRPDKDGHAVYSLRSRDYARFFGSLAGGTVMHNPVRAQAEKRIAFLKAYISGIEDRAGAFFNDALTSDSALPPEVESELDREYKRLAHAKRLDEGRVRRLLNEQIHLPEAQRRDDSYESHLNSARCWPAWQLARNARASNTIVLGRGWTANFHRAVADVALERRLELDAIPIGAEHPASPEDDKREREEEVGPNGETLDTHEKVTEHQSCGGKGQTIRVDTWVKKQKVE
jgi:hypothetical protein